MADSKLTALSEVSAPALTDIGYTVADPAGTPASNKISHQRFLGMGGFIPGGRLTLTSGTAVTTSDVTSAGTLYYTPYVHNLIRVWDGTRWLLKTFSEISLSLTLTSGKNYDVFVDDDAATLSLSSAWTNDTTRADALGTQNSVTVLNSDKTKLWLGTIRASGSNVTADSGGGTSSQVGGTRFVWNAYNRVHRYLAVIDTTDNWTYASASWRQWHNASGNKVEYVVGDAAALIQSRFLARMYFSGSSVAGRSAIGVDSTSSPSGRYATQYFSGSGITFPNPAEYIGYPGLGYHYLAALEYAQAGTVTYIGDEGGSDSAGLYAVLMG